MVGPLAVHQKIALIFLIWIHCRVSGAHHPHTCVSFESCSDCERIFDDDLETFVNLELENGGAKTVEFRAILDFYVSCLELSFLFVNHTSEACNKKNRCQAEEIMQPSDITSCLIKCPKKTNTNKMYEVDLIQGLLPTTLFLRDLRIYSGDFIEYPKILSEKDSPGKLAGSPLASGMKLKHMAVRISCPNNGCPLIPEYLTPKRPAFYLDFDNTNSDQWHNNPEVDYYNGSFCKGIKTDSSLRQWVEVNAIDACLVRPETCTEGATLSAWIKIDECNGTSGMLTTFPEEYGTGFNIRCRH